MSYSANKLNGSNSHYDSQPIYEDDFIDDYTEDDDSDAFGQEHPRSKQKKDNNFFNGKHIPNRSVSNMSYSHKLKHNSNLLSKKSKSTHLSHMDVKTSSSSASSASSSRSSSYTSSSRASSFDNIVKKKSSSRLKTDNERRINSASNRVNVKVESHDASSHTLSSLQQPRRASTANLATPRSISIRRERSVNAGEPLNTNRSNFSETNFMSKFLEEEETAKEKQEKNSLTLKQTLLSSISNVVTSGVKENSSTTSGVESSCKNSTSNGNESNDCKHSTNENTPSVNSPNNNDANDVNSFVVKINELKNSIFILEIELKNERKKLSVEKELKSKLVVELKKRFQVEKEAALKAQEAKLNAEKLYELNKVKDEIDLEKRDEYYQNQKTFDDELISLQLKLREKSEK